MATGGRMMSQIDLSAKSAWLSLCFHVCVHPAVKDIILKNLFLWPCTDFVRKSFSIASLIYNTCQKPKEDGIQQTTDWMAEGMKAALVCMRSENRKGYSRLKNSRGKFKMKKTRWLDTVVNFNVLMNFAPKKLTFESPWVLPVSEVLMFPLGSKLSCLIL